MNLKAFYCLVCGSKTFHNYDLLSTKLDKILSDKKRVVIVSGGAAGADTLAEQYANERKHILKVFPAQWHLYGRGAGFRRNTQMLEFIQQYRPDCGVVAFWVNKSKGTAHTISEAEEKFNIPVRTIKITI